MKARLEPAQRISGLGTTLIRRFVASAPSDAIHLSLGQSEHAPPAGVRAALVGAADDPASARYGPNAGDPALRAAIAERYGASASQIIVTCGTQEAIALALLGLVDPGDHVVVPDPAFPVYATLTRIAGGEPRTYAPDAARRFRPTSADVLSVVSESTKLVVINSPANPTGAVMERCEVDSLVETLTERGIPWLSDEIYLDFQGGAAGHETLYRDGAPSLVASGLAKSHGMAGWRLGWLVAPSEIVEPLTALHQQLVTSASTVVQIAARAAFDEPSLAAVALQAGELARRREDAVASLQKAGWEVAAGDGAFYLWVHLPGWEDELALAQALSQTHGVVTIPGRAFGERGRGYLRVSYAVSDETLREGLLRLRRAAAALGES